MFFQNRPLRGLVKMAPIVLFISIYLTAATADAGYKYKRPTRPKPAKARSPRGVRTSNSGLQETVLYKGESPCRVGQGEIQEIESKFCGFYDHKAAMAKETKIQE